MLRFVETLGTLFRRDLVTPFSRCEVSSPELEMSAGVRGLFDRQSQQSLQLRDQVSRKSIWAVGQLPGVLADGVATQARADLITRNLTVCGLPACLSVCGLVFK
ncbi:hypothetical protein ElyMa_004969200 [Elysia marginata]|uniref:Uncharacterized protein n=1 Tax=Elysia marginata TaxID=1093978 RepID=A0AAV4J552_9GAST|nr:hypothetical protein ElyMa_004969200 [Elysia marginata]